MTSYRTLIGAEDLRLLLASKTPPVVLDCGFDLARPDAGAAAHRAAHVPGAHYVHLDHDLSGPKTGSNGRHPLPARETFARRLGHWGIRPGTQVIAYDDQGGAYASRAWWMLRWMGHEAVAVLDGGLAAWRAAAGPLQSGAVADVAAPVDYPAVAPGMPTVDAAGLLSQLGQVGQPGKLRVLDARAGERFRGETEPLDQVAGHIPGATLRWFKDNLRADGRFKDAATLRAEFDAYATPAERIVHQCGSGVTACHNLLAMAHAGIDGSVLYPGSWSEWCADPARPIAVG